MYKVCCIALVPHLGNSTCVTLPHALLQYKSLDDLKPLGWIHTQPNELLQNGTQVLLALDVKLINFHSKDYG